MRQLFEHCTIVTVNENFDILEDAYLVVEGDTIAYIGASRPQGPFEQVIDGSGKVMMPGLYNNHAHMAMTLFRGYAEGLPLQQWLNEKIFPAEARLKPAYVRAASDLAMAEMIAGGCISFTDMYYFCDQTVQSALEAGVYANISRGVTCFAPGGEKQSAPYTESKALFDEFDGAGDGRIKIDMCIHAEYTNTPGMIAAMAELAAELGTRIHVHVSETKSEHEACLERWGKTPSAYLASLGLFDVPATAAHCVWVDEADIALLGEKGVTVAHCPSSNLKLGSGIAPIARMLAQGLSLTIGTDGASSNNNLNMFEEMHLASLLQKGVNLDPMLLPPEQVLRMACTAGAASQGRRHCGCLKEGYKADLILLDFEKSHLAPCHNVVYNIVYSLQSADVCRVYVRGREIYRDGIVTGIDLERAKYDVNKALRELAL